MARPCKKRRICANPKCRRYRPETLVDNGLDADTLEKHMDSENVISLTLDEYESIRLLDYERLEQEQCARQMGVSRATIQSVYKSAREKLADFLINARELRIQGGDVMLCQSGDECARTHCVGGEQVIIPKGGNIQMRIAVTYEDGQVFQHFGHTEEFKVYDVEDRKVVKTEVLGSNGSGHGALATLLAGNKVDVLICGGIGGGAQNALAEAGIKLYGGVSGAADAAVEALLKDQLDYNPEVQCNHHGEGHEHHENCGNGGCGAHSC